MTDLQIELGHPEDADLLKKCAEVLGAPLVRAGSLKRFGYSGADLFLAQFGRDDRLGIPRVVKIASKEQISEEADGVEAVKNYFVDANDIHGEVAGIDRAAIIYRLISSAPTATDTSPLEDRVCIEVEEDEAGEKLQGILAQLYGGCCREAHGGTRTEFILGDEYQRYRRGDRSEERLTATLGDIVSADPFEYLGTEILDPRGAIDRLHDREISGVIGAVHGDLHPSNVMLDHNSEPHLIDFAWAEDSAHILKDFILMECSLRFLVFPSFGDLKTQLDVDQALLEESGWQQLLDVDSAHPLSYCYRRLGGLIGSIRHHAAEASGPDFDFDTEYLGPQLFALYGLLAYDDYGFYPASRALGMIALKLATSLP